MNPRILSVAILVMAAATTTRAGEIYEVTATKGTEKVVYKVNFGDAKLVMHRTAFDPKSQKFVYLTWKRAEQMPEPVATIWDHKTGETVKLYKFPGVENPLPMIPSTKEMKVCPITGDKDFTPKRVGNYD